MHLHINARNITDKFQHGLNRDNSPNFFFAGDGVLLMGETLVFIMVSYINNCVWKIEKWHYQKLHPFVASSHKIFQ
jgi:hypothetical protein